MTQNIPYGFWPSPITSEYLTAQSIRYSEVKYFQGKTWWIETRPNEKGRSVLVCCDQGNQYEPLDTSNNLRTRAQEYGGSCYCLTEDYIYFVNNKDQAIYAFNTSSNRQKCISPAGNFRYADLIIDKKHQRLIAVRETFTETSHFPVTDIIAINLNNLKIQTLVSGNDFYSNPQISPCSQFLSYLTWNHPQMPWDGSLCYFGKFNADGEIESARLIAGSNTESIFQPQWSPQGELFFVSDRNNWWNIYAWNGTDIRSIYKMNAEFATPQWVFGMSTYGFLNDHEIFCCYSQNGQWNLATIDLTSNKLAPIKTRFCDISSIVTGHNYAAFIASSATAANQVFEYKSGSITSLSETISTLDTNNISSAKAIEFPTSDGEKAYGFFYPPANSAFKNDNTEKPPLIVFCHGGPTGSCETGLNLKIQFWTSRGFAVVDVNYRGSTGYGRQYRDALKKSWGVKDVIDVCSAANYLVQENRVSDKFTIIRGSSAGGFSVLAALTFSDQFSIGCSLYGIGDLEALAKDTHKFEAHYLDSLVGKYPEERKIYLQRSPIHHTEKLNCPVIFFQGLEDKVVPPAQAEAMVNALKKKDIAVEYITFADEGHGFRQAENIKTLYDKELSFYQGFLASN
jgi:dipeptidyl aminopeptidase/acylaminoacyl peptidase